MMGINPVRTTRTLKIEQIGPRKVKVSGFPAPDDMHGLFRADVELNMRFRNAGLRVDGILDKGVGYAIFSVAFDMSES